MRVALSFSFMQLGLRWMEYGESYLYCCSASSITFREVRLCSCTLRILSVDACVSRNALRRAWTRAQRSVSSRGGSAAIICAMSCLAGPPEEAWSVVMS